MNFDFLSSLRMISPFYCYCTEAEEFALAKPDISVAAARKAIEYIVRLLYTAAIQNEATHMSVYDMLCTPDFVMYLDDRTVLDAIHFIRRKGNTAVHQGGLTQQEAQEVLERLHYVAGEVCIFLGLLNDYPAFAPSLLRDHTTQSCSAYGAFDDEEPPVTAEIINNFSKRLQSVQHYSQLRQFQRQFINVHVNTSKYDELEKEHGKAARINTSTNVRAAFDYIATWAQNQLTDAKVSPDYRLLRFTVHRGEASLRFTVRMGCTNLGSRTPDGKWNILPGIDYVLYAFEIDPQRPVLEQFHLFSKEAFLQMWYDLKLVKVQVSTTTYRKLRATLGDDVEITAEQYADTMQVQVFKTSRKKTKLFEEIFAKFPALDAQLLKDVCGKA